MKISRPKPTELSEYHQQLIQQVPETDILKLLSDQLQTGSAFVRSIPDNQMEVVHDGYGWSVRQVVEHCLDAERVFGYRMLRFASGDQVDLPGWDENHYAACGYCQPVDTEQMALEFTSLRQANLNLLNRLSESVMTNAGVADGNPFTVRSLLFVMAGHWIHHVQILKKRLEMDS